MHPFVNPTRRDFLRIGSACAAHLALMARPFPISARGLWSRRSKGQVVAQEPFGRLEEIGDGLWALISTPLLGDYTTVANGGILAGRDGVLAVEAFQTPEGARWMAERARELTGRWPTHVLVTHYHSDHSRGVEGYFHQGGEGQAGNGGGLDTDATGTGGGGPSIHATEATRSLTTRGLPTDAPASLRRRWADVLLLSGDEPSSLDLGGRIVTVDPRRGHTASDVMVELAGEEVIWCGDLVWNGMFPNYMDAVPSQLSRAVRAIRARSWTTMVPGHGPLADSADLDRYATVIQGVEETARHARREGWTAEEAARRHQIPDHLGDWTLFNPSYIQRAVEAWLKEWEGGARIPLESGTSPEKVAGTP
jgi:glyoxylase-like metal-dependent hydrolase (beta-lactamase superfamily II)